MVTVTEAAMPSGEDGGVAVEEQEGDSCVVKSADLKSDISPLSGGDAAEIFVSLLKIFRGCHFDIVISVTNYFLLFSFFPVLNSNQNFDHGLRTIWIISGSTLCLVLLLKPHSIVATSGENNGGKKFPSMAGSGQCNSSEMSVQSPLQCDGERSSSTTRQQEEFYRNRHHQDFVTGQRKTLREDRKAETYCLSLATAPEMIGRVYVLWIISIWILLHVLGAPLNKFLVVLGMACYFSTIGIFNLLCCLSPRDILAATSQERHVAANGRTELADLKAGKEGAEDKLTIKRAGSRKKAESRGKRSACCCDCRSVRRLVRQLWRKLKGLGRRSWRTVHGGKGGSTSGSAGRTRGRQQKEGHRRSASPTSGESSSEHNTSDEASTGGDEQDEEDSDIGEDSATFVTYWESGTEANESVNDEDSLIESDGAVDDRIVVENDGSTVQEFDGGHEADLECTDDEDGAETASEAKGVATRSATGKLEGSSDATHRCTRRGSGLATRRRGFAADVVSRGSCDSHDIDLGSSEDCGSPRVGMDGRPHSAGERGGGKEATQPAVRLIGIRRAKGLNKLSLPSDSADSVGDPVLFLHLQTCLIPFIFSCSSTWIFCMCLPLFHGDWDWIAWPIPLFRGAILGHLIGCTVSFLWVTAFLLLEVFGEGGLHEKVGFVQAMRFLWLTAFPSSSPLQRPKVHCD